MSAVAFGHLVIGAATLEEGVRWCEETLGVTPGPGGRHAAMATHNRCLKLGGAAGLEAYLEIIAIDPDAPAPPRSRWFGLDADDLSQGPRLLAWVARSTMLDMHRWGLITIGLKPGDPQRMFRETAQGRLEWEILLRDDGSVECGGALPTLIQWAGRHPAAGMAESGIELRSLAVAGLPERARQVLRPRGLDLSSASGPAVRATLATPRGELRLETR